MNVSDVRARVTAVRAWAIDHEEYDKAEQAEIGIWTAVLQAIAQGAENPAELAAAALTSLKVSFPRRFG